MSLFFLLIFPECSDKDDDCSSMFTLKSLHSVFENHVKDLEHLNIKMLPKMEQPYFIALWKTLFNIFQVESSQHKELCDALYYIGINCLFSFCPSIFGYSP